MNFIDSVARGWVDGRQVEGWGGEGGSKTNLNRLCRVAMTSSIHTELIRPPGERDISLAMGRIPRPYLPFDALYWYH